MGRSQREKGSRAEREFINELKGELGNFFGDIDKNWNQREETRFDLQLGKFGVEIKRQETMRLASWWEETVAQVEGTELMPMLVYRMNFREWTIVLSMVDVCYLVSGEATNLQSDRTPAGHHDWHKHLTFTISMSLPAFAYFCREYYVVPEVGGVAP